MMLMLVWKKNVSQSQSQLLINGKRKRPRFSNKNKDEFSK